jgi:hypothetical protein
MSFSFMLAQAIGFAGLGFVTYAFQKTSKVEILKTQTIGSILFMIHFSLLDAYIGALLSATVIARNHIFMRKNTHAWANDNVWPYVIGALSVIWLGSAWEGWISLFPVCGMLIATYAMWLDDANKLRNLIIVSSLLWIPYSIYHQAIPSLINQLLVCASACIATRKQQRNIIQVE